MINFMYGFDYDGCRGDFSSMLFNAKLYVVADKYGVHELRRQTKDKFDRAASVGWDDSEFPRVIEEVYSATHFTVMELRDVLLNVSHEHISALLLQKDFLHVLECC